MSNEEQGPTMERMLDEIQNWAENLAIERNRIPRDNFCIANAKQALHEARASVLARYAELEREREAYRADAAIGAIARAHMCETGHGWQFKAFQVYGAPSLETIEDAAIAQRGDAK